ncbi:MAG: mandelate racemase/muconate lactonizing enzyme family protein [Arenicellales bacterium]|nr:mandelate racemase/muconate lactonizing enzyme family protein [Arenicellales bacterium]
MKIAAISVIPLRIPFSIGPVVPKSGGKPWEAQEIVLVKVETENGLVGWGEAFSYSCQSAVVSALEDMVVPLVVGSEIDEIPYFMRKLQQTLHLFGRYGITMFAFSGLDIALWDLAAKASGNPLCKFINEDAAPQTSIEGYSSLYRYGDVELVAAKCQASLDQGYKVIKLHEINEPEVKAARDQIGNTVALTVDTNCPWTPAQAHDMALRFKSYDLLWLEEPIFPPEDFDALAALQKDVGIPLAAGENLCTQYQFQQMLSCNAVTYVQPSVTKVGGVTEFQRVAELTRMHGLKLMPHSPYFGPGWLATLQLMAAIPDSGFVERLFVDHEASLYGNFIHPTDGRFRVPCEPGLGAEPDPDVIKTYRL